LGPAYVRAAYRHWFERGIGSGGDENLRLALADCGQEGRIGRILALSEDEQTVQELDRMTEEARDLGVFGSPSFVVGKEVVWGDDHLENAIQWAKQGTSEWPELAGDALLLGAVLVPPKDRPSRLAQVAMRHLAVRPNLVDECIQFRPTHLCQNTPPLMA
jgi:hypothetical protein